MMKIITTMVCCCLIIKIKAQTNLNDRQLWLQYMDKLARPVLSNLAEGKLKENMQVELADNVDNAANRTSVSYLEAFARTLSGIAPWLNLEGGPADEKVLRDQYRRWCLKAIANAVNPASKDYLKWDGGQPLVDASFLAFGLVRCPWLWQNLDTIVRKQVIACFMKTRNTVPAYSNWILFPAMIESFFCKYDISYDPVRIEYAIREFANHWYIGDGLFSDGMDFHMDYYNSIVIHPYLAAIVGIVNDRNNGIKWFTPKLDKINKRYAEIQERSINTDGTYALIGRSIVYRGGVFHHLADIALRKGLPPTLKPAQVRSALTAVIKKTMGSPNTYNKNGWLTIGVYGPQPGLADFYITTGSLYICSNIFLPLGLPAEDEFWSGKAEPWTAEKVWSGQNVTADHAVDLQ